MPLYNYKCEKCGKSWEEYKTICERNDVSCCGETAEKIIAPTAKPIVYEFYSTSLDAHITGPAQRKKLMKERNLEDA